MKAARDRHPETAIATPSPTPSTHPASLRASLQVGTRHYDYVDLRAAERAGVAPVSRLPGG